MSIFEQPKKNVAKKQHFLVLLMKIYVLIELAQVSNAQ